MPKKITGAFTFITLISSKGKSSLVEYVEDGIVIRKYVPADQVKNNLVADSILESGIPYGYPWDEIAINFDMKQFALEMHNADLWTVEDVLRAPAKLTGVLRKIFEPGFREILELARKGKRS